MVEPPRHLKTIEALRQVVAALLGPQGCPWDKEQTHQSLAPYALEEAFELVEAIESGSQKEMVEELGDYLLQVVLHSEIARLERRFSLEDVCEAINRKMIRRHPHVFSDQSAADSAEVLAKWAQLKESEREAKSRPQAQRQSMFSLPVNLPALQKAQKIGAKTADYCFDWGAPAEVMEKVEEELREFRTEWSAGELDRAGEELGDVLFSLVQLARHLGIEAENSLRAANRRFEGRFFTMLKLAAEQGLLPQSDSPGQLRSSFAALSPQQKQALWDQAKKL